jgi:hypothetical protein
LSGESFTEITPVLRRPSGLCFARGGNIFSPSKQLIAKLAASICPNAVKARKALSDKAVVNYLQGSFCT